jgi:hypothetical protein
MLGSSDFEVQIAHSVEEIGQTAWDHLGGGRPFASYRWYRFGETVLADNTPLYIVLSRQGEPLARATFWLRWREAIPISSPTVRRLLQAILRRRPLLFCQSPLSDTSGMILPDPPLRDAALKTIAQCALDQARRCKVSFLVFDCLERQDTECAGWPEAFVPVEIPDPGTRLTITWPDFEGYLKSLTRKTRRQYHLNGNRAADLGIEIKRHPPCEPIGEATLDRAVTLIRAVEKHHNSAPHPWAREMLQHAGLVEATWLKAEIAGQLAGCCIVLGDGDARIMTLLGRDYSVDYAYFQLIYTAIRCAIEEGACFLRGGSGAYDMKQRLGFQSESSNYVVFSGGGRVLQKFGLWAARWLQGDKEPGPASE